MFLGSYLAQRVHGSKVEAKESTENSKALNWMSWNQLHSVGWSDAQHLTRVGWVLQPTGSKRTVRWKLTPLAPAEPHILISFLMVDISAYKLGWSPSKTQHSMVPQRPGHKDNDGVKPLSHKTVHPAAHSLPPILKGRVLHLGSKNL
jgi:hypothetical protein